METNNLSKIVCEQKIINREVGVYSVLRRIIDILIGFVGLIFVIPIIMITVIFIIIESPGNPFYVQKRMGLMGKEFDIIKLRSMRLDAEKEGAQWAQLEDTRVTKVGKIIRKTRIDELPQIVNVLKGDMTIIGPRPERKTFVEMFTRENPDFPKRLEVNPGITGWAQINGGYDISPKEKLKLDLYYIQNRSFFMDIKILLRTVQIVFTGEGAR